MSAIIQTTQDVVELTKIDVLQRLDKLEAGLVAQDPMIPVHLSHILKSLNQYEELVHLLDDAKVTVIMANMMTYKKVKLIEEAATKKGGKKALSKTTVDDI